MSEKNKKGFFSRIFEDDEEIKENNLIQQEEVNTTAFVSSNSKPSISVSADEDTVNKLLQVIIDENLPGPDYVELKNNVSAIAESGLTTDENQMFKAAYSVLKKSYPNLSKDIIIKSIDKYRDIIEKERVNGLGQFEQLRKEKVDSKNAEIKILKGKRETLEEEIRKKKEELGNIAVELNKLEDEVQENTSTINIQIEKFESSVKKVLHILDSDKDKVNNLNI